MIILDTNVISEIVKVTGQAETRVLTWVGSQPFGSLATTAVTYGESLAGFKMLAPTIQTTRKQQIFERLMLSLFDGRILPFDSDAARAYADIMRKRRLTGTPIAHADAQIAAIARLRGLPVATRDRDFATCGIDVINPWDYTGR